MRPRQPHGQRAAQAGAATLVVVMVLFFVMAMMAAFANRNLIFEQRIAGNYYRSSIAQEAAEAGAEWAIAMLNGINVDESCQPAATATQSFRQRYFVLDPASRGIGLAAPQEGADCRAQLDGSWSCNCLGGTWAAPAAVAGSSQQTLPSFRLSFSPQSRPGVLRLIANSCTSSNIGDCFGSAVASASTLASSTVLVDVALVSALKMPPATPLTARGSVTAGANGLGLHNSDSRGSGLLLWAGGPASGLLDSRLDSLPGTPGAQALISDDAAGLGAVTPDAMFVKFFGMSAARYSQQPAARTVSCSGDCAQNLLTAYNGGARMIWVAGPLRLASNVTLGSADSPVLIVADGAVQIEGPLLVNGLIYARGDLGWTNGSSQPARLAGALMAEGNVTIGGTVDLWYQAALMDALSNSAGSFVRVPGGWWDGPVQ